jgi:hypothetical protein
MMPPFNYYPRSKIQKTQSSNKAGKTLEEKRKNKKQKLLQKLFPLLRLRFSNSKQRGQYQHTRIK